MRRLFVASVLLTVGIAAVNGCGYELTYGGTYFDCFDKTDPVYNKPDCIQARCNRDAGAYPECDAGVPPDAESPSNDGSSARCSGACVPNKPDFFDDPQPVYIGKLRADSFGCPDELGAFGGRQYTDLVVANPGCPSCICGPIEGSCSARPNSILVRAGTCNVSQPATTNFGAPENWDGSCTNVNAVPAGLQCPPGSGIPCAQSVYSSTLLDPEEGCEPIPMPVPNATSDAPAWRKMVLSCSSTAINEPCAEGASTRCMPPLPTNDSSWRYCVRHTQKGVHACPAPSDSLYSKQFVSYDGYIDTRKCTECGCKASGGSCYGTLRVYSDDSCSSNELVAEGLTSEITLCSNLMFPGEVIGSKELTDLTYLPGKCEPTGGLAIGDAHPDESTAVTWCCMPSPEDEDADAGADASVQWGRHSSCDKQSWFCF